jgi:hypothetical protein
MNLSLRVSLLTAVVYFLSAPSVFADKDLPVVGLLYRLPEDGAWSRYEFSAAGVSSGTLTLQSVGKATVDGKPCRWIEGAMDWGSPESLAIGKFLIPEQDIGAEKPLAHAIRGYQRDGKRTATKTEHPEDGLWGMILSGPPRDAKKLSKTEELKWEGGTLGCDAYESRETVEDRIAKLRIAHHVLTHRDVPFGVASHRLDAEVLKSHSVGAVILPTPMLWTFVGKGGNAKSVLPERQ